MSNIPNTFQHPNDFIDALMPLLDDMENICLSFACRKILGWSEHRATLRDHISISQFQVGTGRSRPRIMKALSALSEFNILVVVDESSRKGREFELNLGQRGEIKIEDLKARHETTHQSGAKRTQKARTRKAAVRLTNQPERSDSLTSSGQTDIPVAVRLTNPQNPLSKPTIKTQGGEGANAPPADPPPFNPTHIFEAVFPDHALSKSESNGLAKYITDADKFKTVLSEYKRRNSSKRISVRVIINWYAQGIPPETRAGPGNGVHPAIRTWQAVRQKFPPNETHQQIMDTIGSADADLIFWRDVLIAYAGLGWNRQSVTGPIDWYKRREIPHMNSNGQRQSASAKAHTERVGSHQAYEDYWAGRLNASKDKQVATG